MPRGEEVFEGSNWQDQVAPERSSTVTSRTPPNQKGNDNAMMSNARESIRKMLTVLVLVLSLMAAGLAYAPPAEALACPTGKVVWIKSNTTINAGHGWSIYYNFWSWGG